MPTLANFHADIGSKGFNQIDLAVALGLMMALMALVIVYIDTIVTPQVSGIQSAELRSAAQSLGDIAFADRGIPTDWHYAAEPARPSLGEYIYVTSVALREYNRTGWAAAVISVNITVNEHAYNNSIKAYDGETPLDTNLTVSGDTNGNGLLEWANISFRVNVSRLSKKIVNVYYSQDNTTAVTYVAQSQTVNLTVNATPLVETAYIGFTPAKLSAIHGRNASYLRPRYGIERDFRIEIENKTGATYIAGDPLPTTAATAVNERRVIAQNRTGFINSVKATVRVW
ncbi:MAG: hypothetical protein HY366_00140 [Candidatus Aenigmarchaeota archaeon]|nr:hypothetical protein [Candidatus Aenigmarchaeota archaeon]